MKKMINFIKLLFKPSVLMIDIGLLSLRVLPSYFMFFEHGWGKISNPDRWEKLGSSLTQYLNISFDSINIFFGFAASFSESICAIFIFFGFFTKPSTFLLAFTMFIAGMKHITGTGSPENAFVYCSIFIALFFSGPGKYSIDYIFHFKGEINDKKY